MLGIDPHVEVSVDSFQALPFLGAGTRRIALVQQHLAEQLRGGRRTRHGSGVQGGPLSTKHCGGTRCTPTTRPTSGCARPRAA
ncbi:hypothetical protein AQJ91_42705 [Streptomyces dysideae]|uniref:Uncharacterized protein n=1 Tax=Streptomyces dysideae TaxID=909626 RepID=A0A124IDH7_9ACTN|nr:hypothetical protein AQJ91_42705 [Streptomyces dysideae]